jgi:hypothetical protein
MCQATVPASAVDNGSFDNDGTIVSRSLSPTGPFPKGVTGVTLTVTDNDGASDSCGATVTVLDQTPPVVTCPGNLTTNLPAGVSNAVVHFRVPAATDNCETATVTATPPSGTTFALGTNPVICVAADSAGNTSTCGFNVVVSELPPLPRDLGIVQLKAPKKITLKGVPVTKTVKVAVQNHGPQPESVTAAMVRLNVISLGGCAPPVATIMSPVLPVTLAPRKKVTVVFAVTFDCANDPLPAPAWDYRYVAEVELPGDTQADNDACPHDPTTTDKGCGGKKPDKTLGAEVLTDIVVK